MSHLFRGAHAIIGEDIVDHAGPRWSAPGLAGATNGRDGERYETRRIAMHHDLRTLKNC
jgi:hypothetical protein